MKAKDEKPRIMNETIQARERDATGETRGPVSGQDAGEVFDKLNMGVMQLDSSSHLTYANPTASDILQTPGQDLEGKLLWDVMPAGVSRQLSGELDRARKEDAVVSFEMHYPKPENLWLSFRCMPTSGGITILFEDITEFKAAQESLRKANEELEQRVQERTKNLRQASRFLEEQKELLLSIIDNIPVMLSFYDSAGTVRLVNREFERLAGWSLEEARGMNIIAALYPDPSYRKEVWEHMMRAKPGWKDIDLTTRSGKVLRTSWANVRLSDGSLIGIGIDISSRKKMEESLLRLATAIDQADEGIMILNPEWEIDYVNPAYEALSEYRRDDLVGRPVFVLERFFMDSSYQDIIRSVKKEGKAWNGHLKRRKPSGEIIEINLTVSPVYDEKANLINYVFLARDITDEVRFQRQILQVQKMEAMGNLAGGIANNLKNAFTPILIDTEMLMEDLGERDLSYPILQEMLQATRYGIDLVRHLLIFSGRTSPQKKPIDIVSVFREALNFLRASLPSTIEIKKAVRTDRAMVFADPTQIKQILVNLGSNAGDSMRRQGGMLEIYLSREMLDEKKAVEISPDLAPGPYVRIDVKDTGPGIDAQTLEHIFEPFFTTKGENGGTGLGLSVVHGIVKDHGGAITVESAPGKGTAFAVWLPELKEQGE